MFFGGPGSNLAHSQSRGLNYYNTLQSFQFLALWGFDDVFKNAGEFGSALSGVKTAISDIMGSEDNADYVYDYYEYEPIVASQGGWHKKKRHKKKKRVNVNISFGNTL